MSATIAPLTATGRNLPTEILFAVLGRFLGEPRTADSHRRSFAFQPRTKRPPNVITGLVPTTPATQLDGSLTGFHANETDYLRLGIWAPSNPVSSKPSSSSPRIDAS